MPAAPLASRPRTSRRCVALAVAMLLAGCAGPQRLAVVAGAPLAQHPRIGLLTLENLSGAPDAGERLTRLLGAEITSRGLCELVDIGQVQGALRRLRIRNTAVMSLEQVRSLGDSLGARYLLTGSVLEHATLQTDDGPIPTAGAALKLIDVASGHVVWAKSLSVTGKDRETVFGYGREIDAGKLDARLVDEMLADFTRLSGEASGQGKEKKR
jgi:TolB-like protein